MIYNIAICFTQRAGLYKAYWLKLPKKGPRLVQDYENQFGPIEPTSSNFPVLKISNRPKLVWRSNYSFQTQYYTVKMLSYSRHKDLKLINRFRVFVNEVESNNLNMTVNKQEKI
jgi:hypothetical protein